jgi:hypothetical protein
LNNCIWCVYHCVLVPFAQLFTVILLFMYLPIWRNMVNGTEPFTMHLLMMPSLIVDF